MPRKFLHKFIPDAKSVRGNRFISKISFVVDNPHIWHLSRRSFSRAFFIGLLIAWLPLPFQMVAVAFLSVLFSANLPVSIALVWLSNPFTIPFFYYVSYVVGSYILGIDSSNFSIENFIPLFLGGFVLGLMFGVIGYFASSIWWIQLVRYRRRT